MNPHAKGNSKTEIDRCIDCNARQEEFMKRKRFLTVFLAAAMVLSGSALTAWADESVPLEASGAAVQEIVTVPAEDAVEMSAGESSPEEAAYAETVEAENADSSENEYAEVAEGSNLAAESIEDKLSAETPETTAEEEVMEAEDEEQLLAAEVDVNKDKFLKMGDLTIAYDKSAEGTDGKGGTWKWDGKGNLELNNVRLSHIHVQGECTITLNGDNYLSGTSEECGLTANYPQYIDNGYPSKDWTLTVTGPGTLHTGGGINVQSGKALKILNTHIEAVSNPNCTFNPGVWFYFMWGGDETTIISNSDIYMHNDFDAYKYGQFMEITGIKTMGSIVIDNSNITIDTPCCVRADFSTITLKDCSIVEKGVSVYSEPGGRIAADDTYMESASSQLDKLTIRRNTKEEPAQTTPHVSYRTHVQKDGWQGYVKDGAMSGTTGQSKRLEAINIQLTDVQGSGIEYRTHVQKYGWQNWVKDNALAGTSGESKRLEAIQIRLTGDVAKQYDVYYQTHIQGFGWSGWASNGEMCGSAGYSRRLEGISIKLVKKGDPAPGSTANCYYLKAGSGEPVSKISGSLVGYNTHVQTYGWQNYAYDGAMAGTKGESKRLEGIHINLVDKPYSGDIVYRTHVQKYGWQGWKKNGEMSGTSGESKRLEGIQIYLTGEMAKHYDVYYRVHAQTYGWLDWAKNGAMAGTSGLSKRLEGINIVLVEKGGKAPGSTAKPNVVGTGGKLPDNPYKG